MLDYVSLLEGVGEMLRPLREFWAKGVGQKVAVISVAGVVALCSCCGLTVVVGAALGPTSTSPSQEPGSTVAAQQATATTSDTPTHVATATATATATPTPQAGHYPPKTQADVQWLAARGTASAVHTYTSESVGLVGACPQPRREVIVDPSVTGQQLAEDLLAYFYGEQLDSPCGSLVLAYNHQSEAGDIYTAGRINLDVTDSSGQANTDPNATDLTYTLTLDIGGALVGQEYVITYRV